MSQAGIEPATYGSHTKQVSANLGPMLYQLSYRDHWFKASPRHFSDCFISTGRMQPKLHEEVLLKNTGESGSRTYAKNPSDALYSS